MDKTPTNKKKTIQEQVFDGLGFEEYEFETPDTGKFICYKGPDGCFYRIHTNSAGESVIEYADTEKEAQTNGFGDADWFDGDPETMVAQMRAALMEYIEQ